MNGFEWYFSFLGLMALFIIQIISPNVLSREICHNGCMVPKDLNSKVQFEAFYHNGSKVESSNIKCFPFKTKLSFFCKNESLNQINPKDDYYRECSGRGWKDSRDLTPNEFPNCLRRESNCFSPSGINGFETRINGRIVSADNETKSYLAGTKAYYRCIDPNHTISMRLENGSSVIIQMFYRQCARKTKKWLNFANKNLSEEFEPTCILRKQEEDELGGDRTMSVPRQTAETNNLNHTTSKNLFPEKTTSDKNELGQIILQRNIGLGFCCLLGVILVMSVLYIYRIRRFLIAAKSKRHRTIEIQSMTTEEKKNKFVSKPNTDVVIYDDSSAIRYYSKGEKPIGPARSCQNVYEEVV